MNKYLSVIFLYSGQYALFYIFMNLSMGTHYFFNDLGLIVLLCALFFQILVSTFLIKEAYLKALATFITPFFFTLYDSSFNENWIYNISHSFFWIFTALVATFIIIEQRSQHKILKIIAESFITFLNIFIFIFLFFYFTLQIEQHNLLLSGAINELTYEQHLQINKIIIGFKSFLLDPSHIYLTLGGFFLALTIVYNRVENIILSNKIEHILDTYLDAQIKKRLLANDILGKKQELVIMFSDIRNFTKLSETNTPTDVVKTLDLYYSTWDSIAQKHNGMINKFIGDAVLVIFGLNDEKSSHLQNIKNAISATKTMHQNMNHLNQTLKDQNLPLIERIGTSIHFGEVIVGSIGGEKRKDYTVIGDNVNISAKLESLCKKYNTDIIVSQNVYSHIENKEDFKYLDKIQLKGKKDFTSLYTIQ